jgi:hypothetical protein
VNEDSRSRRRTAELTNRLDECAVLDRLIGAVRAGESRVLVLRGEPGIGKTVLLDYLAERAPGCRVTRAVGVQSEMELAFAGLHQLLARMLDHLEGLPVPQADALRTAFGLSAGPTPDRFLVGLAVLGLLSEAAGQRPLVCLVDDAQWLDRASAQVLGFVARRLAAEPAAVVFAARDPGEELAGLPELAVRRPGAWRVTLAWSAVLRRGCACGPAGGWCEQAEGAGPLDGFGAAARAELLVQVPLVRLDGVRR